MPFIAVLPLIFNAVVVVFVILVGKAISNIASVAGFPRAIPRPPLRISIVKKAGESKVVLEDLLWSCLSVVVTVIFQLFSILKLSIQKLVVVISDDIVTVPVVTVSP